MNLNTISLRALVGKANKCTGKPIVVGGRMCDLSGLMQRNPYYSTVVIVVEAGSPIPPATHAKITHGT
jgi:hypothetical protein